MNQENKKIVMFDFDGVLIDTLLPCYKINVEANEDLDMEEYKNMFNGNIHTSLKKTVSHARIIKNFLSCTMNTLEN